MASTIVLLAALALAIYASVLIWRGRRLSTAGSLKDVTVSREWLMHHQTDDF
jgi:hypothetical protein